MRLAALRGMGGTTGAGGVRSVRASRGFALQALLIAALGGGLLVVVSLYGAGLRDARYLDGWVLGIGMGLQICFHVALKTRRMAPKSVLRWRTVHIVLGYALIAAFLSHTDYGMPDTGLELALWGGFIFVALSGAFGTYLAWSVKTKHGIGAGFNFERIPARRDELAREVHAAVTQTAMAADDLALPALPYNAWILDLYATHLREFFQGPRNGGAHLIGSREPQKRLLSEIETLSRFVDAEGREKLAVLEEMVREKDRLDFARVYLGLTKGWLYVHVPVTYALIILSVLHGIVVYAYSSGAW